MQQSIFSLVERPANPSPSPGSARALTIRVATWPSSIWALLNDIGPAGWCGRTCPVSCRAAEDGILVPSSEGWLNSGMGGPTESWTLNTSEHACSPEPFPSAGDVCSLSDILETGDLPTRYYLTAKACSGILRRAGKRGKALPTMLLGALSAVAEAPSAPEIPEAKTRSSRSKRTVATPPIA